MALSSRSLALGITQQVWSFGSPDFPRNSTSELATTSPTLSQLPIVQVDRVFYRCKSRHPTVLIVGILIGSNLSYLDRVLDLSSDDFLDYPSAAKRAGSRSDVGIVAEVGTHAELAQQQGLYYCLSHEQSATTDR